MKIAYINREFYSSSKIMIEHANEIIEEYQALGFDLTIRQLHYQFVSRDLAPNTQKHYNSLNKTMTNARRAGLVDWQAIVDRTRYTRSVPHWNDEADVLAAVADQFRIDKWQRQAFRPRVWVEKDALIGVISETCTTLDIPYFSSRGYASDSAVWRDAMRFGEEIEDGYTPVVIHLADHDPSGLDMTRDITDRLALFEADETEVRRIALTINQVREYDPPPNFAKEADPRWAEYFREYGEMSWELDALEPTVLASLITDTVLPYRDDDLWTEDVARENDARAILESLSNNVEAVKLFLEEIGAVK